MSAFLDLTGHKYGRLTVTGEAGRAKDGRVLWNCSCSCGETCVVRSNVLRKGDTKSCGCLRKENTRLMFIKNVEMNAVDKRKYRDFRCNIAKGYNITEEQYRSMMDAQQGCCAICGESFLFDIRESLPHIDHNHKTGKIRGLLCSHCNVGLGHFRDSQISLAKAINYLKLEDLL